MWPPFHVCLPRLLQTSHIVFKKVTPLEFLSPFAAKSWQWAFLQFILVFFHFVVGKFLFAKNILTFAKMTECF